MPPTPPPSQPLTLHELIGRTRNAQVAIRKEAATALGRLKDARAVAPLADMLRDGNKDVRRVAGESLAHYGDMALPALAEALTAKRAAVRRAAIGALGAIRSARAFEVLSPAMVDPSPVVRIAAAKAIAGFKDARVTPALIKARADRDMHVRTTIHDLLRGVPVEPFVLAVFQENETARIAAACILAEQKNPQALEVLLKADVTAVAQLHADIVAALGHFSDPRIAARLFTWLGNADKRVRLQVARALAAYGDDTTELLVMMLAEDNALEREGAAVTLGFHNDYTAVKPLIEALGDSDSHVRRAAARALGELRDNRAGEGLLLVALSDPSTYTRRDAARALGKIGDRAVVGVFVAVLADPVPIVRRAAAISLGRMQGWAASDALTAATQDMNEAVRSAAAAALRNLRK